MAVSPLNANPGSSRLRRISQHLLSTTAYGIMFTPPGATSRGAGKSSAARQQQRVGASSALGCCGVLVIQADQHRWDCLGVNGNPDVLTPHIDALVSASGGVSYTNAFCPYPVCTPSRYSFLASLYVHQHLGRSNKATLPSVLPTFPKVMRAHGWRTHSVGKMHFSPTYLDVGYDEMELAEQNGAGRLDDDYHRWLQAKGQHDEVDLIDQEQEYRQRAPQNYWDTVGAIESNLSEAHHSTTWIGDRAVEALERWDPNGPAQVLHCSFIKPHHPFDPPAPWSKMYDPDTLTLLPGWLPTGPPDVDTSLSRGYFPNEELTEHQLRRAMSYYYATISQIDHHIGRMVALLKEKGLYERTMIVYTSDHGEFLGFHHMLLKGNHMYDPLIKVPLVIKYPAGSERGQQVETTTHSQELVNLIDVGPTILSEVGLPTDARMQGLPIGNGKGSRMVFAEAGHGYMARSDTHKLLLCRRDQLSQFFDLVNDPLEMKNLYADPSSAGLVAEYKRRLMQWTLFDTPARPFLDESAAIITAPNAQLSNGDAAQARRKELADWFRRRMDLGVLRSD